MSFPTKTDEPERTLFVGNLEGGVREEILYELFLQAGPVTKVTICKDKDGRPKTFGFVCFKHTESVPYAIALLNGIRLYGRPIKVQYRFGSSHCPELNNHCQNVESSADMQSPTYRNSELYGSSPLHVSTFQINNSPLQGYSSFQNMMTYFLAQYNPMERQFPYYQMIPPPPQFPSFPASSYSNPGQTSFEHVYPEPKNHMLCLINEDLPNMKRQLEISDSDSSMESDRKKTKRK
ncbi:splicing regulator RBM11 isoform X2 [Heteronotia binoei]|uniref:splicing regulator RBM11 isoform X2 n=1 Tax=Heteronotia binoei TaxID=13085 RepID=UPI0029319E04|nr:splicing regulator RBM11 isoform X2 [Heteronotia binoei]